MKIIYSFSALVLCVLFLSCNKDNKFVESKPKSEVPDPIVKDSVEGIFVALKKNSDSIRLLPFIGPSLKIKTYDGANQTTHPSVLYFPEKWNGWKLWMVHTPYPFSKDFYENPSIAVSNDGINWTTPEGFNNPLDYCEKKLNDEKYHYSDGALVYREDLKQLECWYRYSKNGVLEEIWRRTSKDGRTWSNKELMLETDGKPINMVMSPAIIWENGKYKMWAVTASPFRVEYRESENGKNWTKPLGLKIQLSKDIVPWHVEVKKTDLGYEMLLNAFNDKGKDANTKFLMSSISSNGIDWEEFKNSMKASEQKGKWNGKMIYRSSFIKVDKLYIVYYSAMSFDIVWGLGIAMGNSLDNLVH